ncbi:hypothetical protein Pve01_93080 [Planomonospora venezuelensis]|nr:hypothetical protein Pve01_93080 [Planomonospora venezuelensis]
MPVRQVEPHQPVQRVVATTGQATPGQGDVHLPDRPPGPVCVRRPAQEDVQPLLLVGVEQLHGVREGQCRDHEARHEHLERDPAEHQHGAGDGAQEQRGREVGLEEDQADGQRGDEQRGREASRPRPLTAQDQGQRQEQAQLGELGRLHGQRSQGDPPLGTPDRHAADVDRHQQQHAERVAPPPQPAQAGRAPPAQDDEQHHPAHEDRQLVPDGRLVTERREVGQPQHGEERDGADGERIEEVCDGEPRRPDRPRAGPASAQHSPFDAEHGRSAAQ